ncbi:MAG: phosphoribosyltransferase [Gemmatimonadota bacterium]|nr:phosphoribosyltransferase [Gemmatimonadota bacterium]
MIYRDRADAGHQLTGLLCEQLPTLRDEDPVVLATFPNGVPVGRALADSLGAPLDVLVARRLGAPGSSDVGIGAVASGGARVLDAMTIRMLGVPDEYIELVSRAEAAEAERQMHRVRARHVAIPLRGRVVVLTDDGSATRWHAQAAIAAVREQGADRLIVAVPLAASDVRDLLAREADAIVCGAVPERSCDVGAHYADSTTPSAESVRRLLAGDRVSRRPTSRPARSAVKKLGPGPPGTDVIPSLAVPVPSPLPSSRPTPP